jgi:hypothetical protein
MSSLGWIAMVTGFSALLMMALSGLTIVTTAVSKELKTVTALLMAGLASTDLLLGIALSVIVVMLGLMGGQDSAQLAAPAAHSSNSCLSDSALNTTAADFAHTFNATPMRMLSDGVSLVSSASQNAASRALMSMFPLPVGYKHAFCFASFHDNYFIS